MTKVLRSALILAALATTAWGSSITGGGDLFGTGWVVSGTVNDVQKSNELLGMFVTATFANGTFTCTMDGTGLCSNAGNFSLLATPATAQTSSADWIITNLRTAPGSANDILLSLQIDAIPGLTVFNPRITTTNHPTVNGNGNCAPNPAVGTAGFGGCGDVQNGQGGSTTATATVLYTNEARFSTDSYHGDLWGTLVFTFTQTSGITFAPGTDFQFKVDTDGIGAAVVDTPEPSSMLFLGLGLAALFLRKKLQLS